MTLAASQPDKPESTPADCPTKVTTTATFDRDARLLEASDFARAFKKNRRLSNHCWTVLAHRQTTPAPARLGLAIAKKRAKRAVDRNRMKRIARESFRLNRDTLSGFDVVVMNRNGATTATAAELRRGIDALWAKIN
ncbi:MAG: ribonuclease P protein component [Granulosicoccus sp.]